MLGWNRLSIQSKLVMMMVLVSVGSLVIISYLGYVSGRDALTRQIENQLDGIRMTKSIAIQNLLKVIRGQVITLSASPEFLNAFKTFHKGHEEVGKRTMDPAWSEKLRAFYAEVYMPALAKCSETVPVLDTYLPRSSGARYLQYQYLAKNDLPYEQKSKLDRSGDGSAYDLAHQNYHPYLRSIVDAFGYEDLMLIDSESGDIVYSEQKTPEFATNLLSGPYANSNLGTLFRRIRKAADRDDYQFEDFEHWRPSLNDPAAFVASPIFDANKMIGILALQFPAAQFNRIMTGNESWEREGLGKTGEVFLIGNDYRCRSRSRMVYEDLPSFLKLLRDQNKPSKMIDAIERMKTAVLNLEVKSEAAMAAIQGKTGRIQQIDYRGIPVLASFQPLEVEGLQWAVVAKMDTAEAFAPVYKYARKALAYASAIILLVTLLAFWCARSFVKPIYLLAAGARQVSQGRDDVVVRVNSKDEYRELADAFNDMTRNLKLKNQQIEQKIREYEELLLNILPNAGVARRKEGNDEVTETFADVTVLFAEIEGFTTLSESLSADQSIRILNELIVAFDEAAERFGVEKVKTIGTSYMAVCGLSVQRPDHTHRVIEFAQELLRIIRRFNLEHDLHLDLQIGVNAGPVVGGIVGRNKFIYDLWGDTVNVAKGLRSEDRLNTILVTTAIVDRVARAA